MSSSYEQRDRSIQIAVNAWRQGQANAPDRYAHTDGVAIYRLTTCIGLLRAGGEPPIVNVYPLGVDKDTGEERLSRTQAAVLKAVPHAIRVRCPPGASYSDLIVAVMAGKVLA